MARVLLFGINSKQLETRQWFLNKLYDSVPVSSIAEFKAHAAQGSVDLVVLCETVSQEDVHTADVFLHQNCPTARVLALHQGADNSSSPSESAPGALDGSSAFLQKVAEQLRAA
jgi:hypothetical protein